MAASGNRVVAVAVGGSGDLVWTSWELGGGGPGWELVPFELGAPVTHVAPAVSFRTTEEGATPWLGVVSSFEGQVFESLQQPDGTFGEFVPVPGPTTQQAASVSDGNLAVGAPVIAVVAAAPDDLTYVNVSLADQPPDVPPPGYWQPVDPSPWTTLAPAIAVVDSGQYMFLVTADVDLGGGRDLQLVLTQVNPFDPGNVSAQGPMGFATRLSAGIASANNRAVVVAADPAGVVSYNWWDLGEVGSGWVQLGSDVTVDQAPAIALVDGGNYMFIIAHGTDGQMYLNQGNVGGGIVGWQQMS